MKKSLTIAVALMTALAIEAADKISINNDWQFSLGNNTQAHTSVNLPHTWNALDGQDGGNNYYRGAGVYTKTIDIPSNAKDGAIYLYFEASNMKTDVWIDDSFVGTHTGGYSEFAFDITPFVKPGKPATLKIKVDNSKDIVAPPLGGDFTFFGGINRDLWLYLKPSLHIAPLTTIEANEFIAAPIAVASPGVRVSQRKVTPDEAILDLSIDLRNTAAKKVKNSYLDISLIDAEGAVVATEKLPVNIAPKAQQTLTTAITLAHPHLWQGTDDPYRYTLSVALTDKKGTIDRLTIPLGLRHIEIDKHEGVKLNGRPYLLRGISLHDAVNDKGRAVSNADRKQDIDMMLQTGANFLRLTHYPHAAYTYNYLDSLGIICWTEIPVVEQIASEADVEAFTQNCAQQLYEMVYQLQNHPSIVCWGLANEVRQAPGADAVPVITHLNNLSHHLDTTRPSAMAHNGWFPECSIPDVVSFNIYNGWYSASANDFGRSCDGYQSTAKQPVGVSEYGAGANILQHEYPPKKPATTGPWHPEEYQNLYHEIHLKHIDERPWLWQTSIWVGIDFASDHRAEGEQPGINDKGLVTFDRKTKKDIYYLYKSAWNHAEPTLYLTGRRFTDRKGLIQPIKAYTNCTDLRLTLNGRELPAPIIDGVVALWDSIPMQPGTNTVELQGSFGGKLLTDKIQFNATATDDEAAEELSPSEAEKREYLKEILPASPAAPLKEISIIFTNKAQAGNAKLTITNADGNVVYEGKLIPSKDKSHPEIMTLRPGITAPGTYTIHFNPSCVRVGGVPNGYEFESKIIVK